MIETSYDNANCHATITKKLTKNGKILEIHEVNEIVEKYKTGNFSYASLSKEYGSTVKTITKLLVKHGVTGRSKSQFQRKYPLNENYFNEVDTEEKAYFLGLLYSDGFNNEKRGRVSLDSVDECIVQRLNKAIDLNKPLYIREYPKKPNNKKSYSLMICSKKISNRLKELGCPQRKSLIIDFPGEDIIPKNLRRFFIRGYFDGNGYFNVSFRKSGYKQHNFSICSTRTFCTKLSNILKEDLDINTFLDKPYPNIAIEITKLKISGRKQIYKFLDWIYDGANIFIDRKYNKYLQEKI